MDLRRSKPQAEFNMSSLTDIIFLLLIFFMLTSTLVNPNALKLLLPKGGQPQRIKQTVRVEIKDTKGKYSYYVNEQPVTESQIEGKMLQAVKAIPDNPGVVLSADKSVPIENVVYVMDIANRHKLKMVLATEPK